MTLDLQGSQVGEGNTKASNEKTQVIDNAQPSEATLLEVTNPQAGGILPPLAAKG